MIKPEYQFSDITAAIIGCAMKVHSAISKGFPEYIYQRVMEIEKKTSYSFKKEIEWPVYYDGQLIAKRRVDFAVAENVMVELKATSVFEPSHSNQIINYLQASQLPAGCLSTSEKIKLNLNGLPITN